MRLRYTPRALAELEQVLSYLMQRSPQGARSVQSRIQEVIDLLTLHPHLGQVTRRRGIRRVVIFPYPYLVFYRVDADEIVILGVRHSARKPSSTPGA